MDHNQNDEEKNASNRNLRDLRLYVYCAGKIFSYGFLEKYKGV